MLTDLADAARGSGLPVVEVPDWRTRGHGGLAVPRPSCIILHHTAGPAAGDAPSLAVVRDGRPDLAGPLSHLVLARSGTVHVVAAGQCWHAGPTFQPWQSNAHTIGIEAEATGKDVWPDVQYKAYVRLCRALADHYRVPYARVLGHKEVASPRGRKVDPNFSMPAFRAAVGAVTSPKAPPNPGAEPVVLQYGMRHPDVLRLQTIATTRYPSYASWSPLTDYFGDKTRAFVEEFQRRSGLDPDGIVGPLTRAKLGL